MSGIRDIEHESAPDVEVQKTTTSRTKTQNLENISSQLYPLRAQLESNGDAVDGNEVTWRHPCLVSSMKGSKINQLRTPLLLGGVTSDGSAAAVQQNELKVIHG